MIPPAVRLFRNPWSTTISNGELIQLLQAAANSAAESLQSLIRQELVEEGRDSLAVVILDPTRPRSAVEFADCVLATIEIGSNARSYLPNAAAKADAHDRHGVQNGLLIQGASHCLGDGDFAWGNSAEFNHAIAGASGLSVSQDGEFAFNILKAVMEEVRALRDTWLSEQRQSGNHRWYNPNDKPAPEYVSFIERPTLEPTLM